MFDGLGLRVGAHDGVDFVLSEGGGFEEVEEGAAEVAGGTGEEDVAGHVWFGWRALLWIESVGEGYNELFGSMATVFTSYVSVMCLFPKKYLHREN